MFWPSLKGLRIKIHKIKTKCSKIVLDPSQAQTQAAAGLEMTPLGPLTPGITVIRLAGALQQWLLASTICSQQDAVLDRDVETTFWERKCGSTPTTYFPIQRMIGGGGSNCLTGLGAQLGQQHFAKGLFKPDASLDLARGQECHWP